MLGRLAEVAKAIQSEGSRGSIGYLLNPAANEPSPEEVATSPLTAPSSGPPPLTNSANWTADDFFLNDSRSDGTVGRAMSVLPAFSALPPLAIIPHAPGQSASSSRRPRGGLTGIDKRTCHICQHRFREVSALRKHVRSVHEKVRSYSCSICSQPFAERSNMKKHFLALHKDERPHVCGECGKRFHFTDGLARHTRNVHRGLRPFACARCGFQFKQRTHLQKHQRNVSCSPT